MDDLFNRFGQSVPRVYPQSRGFMLDRVLGRAIRSDADSVIAPFSASGFLRASAIFCFLVTLIGQWIFFYYIIAFYGFSVVTGNLEIWNRFEPLGSTPYVAGDFGGNLAFAAHALGAGIVAFGGALQLIPQIRAHFPRFHRINGYVYLITVTSLALSGFYLVWIRGTSPDAQSAVGTSINGVLILVFAFFAVRHARNRDIVKHRKWAMRLFLVSNAQWFLRVGVFSYLITGTILGLAPGFGDPFFVVWTFGCFLLPLLMLQLYFFASERSNKQLQYVTSGLLIALSVLLIVGVAGFTPFMQALIDGETIAL